MSDSTSHDTWRRYWAALHESGRRLQLENAARKPRTHWLVADAATLVEEEYGLDPDSLRRDPDATLAAAREGFAAFVETTDLTPTHPDDGYEAVPVHLTTVRRVPGIDPGGIDPVEQGNGLVLVAGAPVVEEPGVSVRATSVTYRCPRDHETVVQQPLLEHWALETCDVADCSLPVVPDPTRTRTRRVCRFTVDIGSRRLPCVATGRYAEQTDERERLREAGALDLTGILRLPVVDGVEVDPTLEVLHAEPA